VTHPDKTVTEQLRIEPGEVKAGDDPAAQKLLIASSAGAALLRVAANGTVTIPGKLKVTGHITVAGGAPGGSGGGAKTLSALAAREANVLADAQALFNTLTNTDLVTSNQGISTHHRRRSYKLKLATSGATAVNGIAVYQTVIAGGSVLSRRFIARGVNLQKASTTDFSVSIPDRHVTVNVLAAGVGDDGQPRAATLSFST
jgi:hypothetical protein